MLNWAARYYPIVRVLKNHKLFHDASLLEIGSGSVGIGRFRPVPFVGCDISFPFEPLWPMTAVTASATQLPMNDKQFDVVLASDMLEHVPLQQLVDTGNDGVPLVAGERAAGHEVRLHVDQDQGGAAADSWAHRDGLIVASSLAKGCAGKSSGLEGGVV